MDNHKSESYFSMGPRTLAVPMALHRLNQRRLCEALTLQGETPEGAVVLLQGGNSFKRYDTNFDNCAFRQESFFHWLFGTLEPGCYGSLEVTGGKTTLFVPCHDKDKDYAIYMGKVHSTEHFRQRYKVDEVCYVDEMAEVLSKKNPSMLLTLQGQNTAKNPCSLEARFDGIDKFTVVNDILRPVMVECRVIKTKYEKEVLRYTNKVSSEAHKEVMRRTRPGMFEYQLESNFLHYVYNHGGMRHVACTCTCATGENAAVLYYGHAGAPNNALIKDGDICLIDLGGEYYCYASDIASAFPANGKFTPNQKMLYDIVLKAVRDVIKSCKPGVSWLDMHLMAERIMLTGLRDNGLLTGDIEAMMGVRLGAVFMPGGLGHFMGLDVVDVGGYPKGTSIPSEPGLKNLRTTRSLQEGMCLTVEPGIYFIDHVLDEAFESAELAQFLVKEKVETFRGTGGIRIEENLLVTADGMELLTEVPRTTEEVEELMAEGRRLYGDHPQE